MIFPREHHWKPKNSMQSGSITSKNSGLVTSQGGYQISGRGSVRIEQYEYQEENLLGMGYSSKVYLGHLVDDMRKRFAIKVIDKRKISKEKQNLALLKQQMEIHSKLDHPNIIKCYQIIERPHHYYFVLEYCPQGTLDAFIKKHKKLTQSTTVTIMEQIISGAKYLLEQKVIHRDLKPPNILKSGHNWKICDFGFSVMGKKNLIGDINVGTPTYMAPESLERTYYSPKTDFFSLGIICYEMLFGSVPWQHKNQKTLLSMMKQQKISEQNLSSLTNSNLAKFITRCCEPIERKRMALQQFQQFTFWKDYESKAAFKIADESKGDLLLMNKSMEFTRRLSTCPSQTTNFSTAKVAKKESTEDIFRGNNSVVERQLFICQILLSLMKNTEFIKFTDGNESELYTTILGKHAGFILRRVRHIKCNYLCLKKWEEYCLSEDYKKLSAVAGELSQKLQTLLRAQTKRKSIVTIRIINKKYDQLTYDKNLSSKCITNLKEYIFQFMRNLVKQQQQKTAKEINSQCQITQNISYLNRYYRYVNNLNVSFEMSRATAICQDSQERQDILDDFRQSILRMGQFKSLREQIQSICI